MPLAAGAAFNLAAHLLDARLEEGRGGAVAIQTPTEALTYAEVKRRSERLAAGLRAAGIVRGDRVLVALPDGPDFVAAFFATLKLGAIVAMANPDVPPTDHAYLLAYTGARALVTCADVARRAGEAIRAAAALRLCLVAGEDAAGFLPLALAERSGEGAAEGFTNAPTRADDVAMWLFTSGSTGQPKAAVHAHRDFAHHAECYAKGVLGMGPDDVTIAVPRLYFPYATGMALMFPFAVGARTVLFPEHPTPARLFELVERFRPTVLATVPTMTAKLLAAPDAGARDLSSLRLAVTAGEALPPELHRRWLEAFGVEMLDGIGSAEMFHIYISNRRGAVRAGSLGQVVPGYEARVVRPDGGDAPDGEPGTLWVRGGSMLSGYHDDPGKTAATLRDGWVVSGDVFRREGGHFFYEGRADDMLKVGGIYVSPLEVEHALAAHPSVVECAVVGYEDGDGLTKARAFVAFRPDAPGDDRARFAELAAWARARLARYKVPRDWVACAALPRNDRGKIVRRALRGG